MEKNILKAVIILVIMILSYEFAYAEKLELAPDFQLRDLNNDTVILSHYKYKCPVLLFFWATWCPYCRKELKVLNDKYMGLVKEGLEVLPINVGESAYKVGNFLQSYHLGLGVLLDKDSSVAEAYRLFGLPTYYLIDKKGYICFQGYSFPEKYKDLISEDKSY